MRDGLIFDPSLSAEELRGFTRTVAEIEWLLLILVLLYQVVLEPEPESSAALAMAMFFFAAFVIAFHFVNFYRSESQWKLAFETLVMIAFITWVLVHTGRLESPLLNLYLLVIITTALTLGKRVTLLVMALLAGCYLWLGYDSIADGRGLTSFTTTLMIKLAPLLLVAYITTMLAVDIRRAVMQVRTLAETDALTGLFNMRAFTVLAENVLKQAARYRRPFSLLMIDSDSLKAVNDKYGHEAGNELLKLTTRSISKELRESDLVARYGGDEFIVLLPETGASGAMHVAEKIRRSIAHTPLHYNGTDIPITASIGVACYPEHGASLDVLKQKADQAMYASKNGGKNRAALFDGSVPSPAAPELA
jgi:diguanylate cyclase (GGDEF)-like protein